MNCSALRASGLCAHSSHPAHDLVTDLSEWLSSFLCKLMLNSWLKWSSTRELKTNKRKLEQEGCCERLRAKWKTWYEAQLRHKERKKNRKTVLSLHQCMTSQHFQLPLGPNKWRANEADWVGNMGGGNMGWGTLPSQVSVNPFKNTWRRGRSGERFVAKRGWKEVKKKKLSAH